MNGMITVRCSEICVDRGGTCIKILGEQRGDSNFFGGSVKSAQICHLNAEIVTFILFKQICVLLLFLLLFFKGEMFLV